MTSLEEAVDDLIDVIAALPPMWQLALFKVRPDHGRPELQSLQRACQQLIGAVITDGPDLDTAHAAVSAAARAMPTLSRQNYVQALFRPEMPMEKLPAEASRYWTRLAAVLAAADTEAEKTT